MGSETSKEVADMGGFVEDRSHLEHFPSTTEWKSCARAVPEQCQRWWLKASGGVRGVKRGVRDGR